MPLCFLPLRCLYSALPDSASFQRRPLLPGRNATGKKWDCHLIQVLHRAAQSRPSPLHPSTEMRLPGGPSPTYFLSPPFEIFYFLHSDLFTPPPSHQTPPHHNAIIQPEVRHSFKCLQRTESTWKGKAEASWHCGALCWPPFRLNFNGRLWFSVSRKPVHILNRNILPAD